MLFGQPAMPPAQDYRAWGCQDFSRVFGFVGLWASGLNLGLLGVGLAAFLVLFRASVWVYRTLRLKISPKASCSMVFGHKSLLI